MKTNLKKTIAFVLIIVFCAGLTVTGFTISAAGHSNLAVSKDRQTESIACSALKDGVWQATAPANKVGVIDSDYRGEIMVALYNQGEAAQTVEHGDRIAQMVFVPYYTADFVLCDNLDETVRGAGGFGSTGIK